MVTQSNSKDAPQDFNKDRIPLYGLMFPSDMPWRLSCVMCLNGMHLVFDAADRSYLSCHIVLPDQIHATE